MSVAAFQSRDEALAGGLAFAMHVLFLVLLVFGVSWQHKPVETAAVVDLWRDLPAMSPPKAEVAPPAPVKPEPPPPRPRVEAKPPPKPEPAPAAKPDIALKDKQEKERRLKAQDEEKKRAEEKLREAEAEKTKRAAAEALKKKQAAEADALKKKQAAEADARRLASEEAKAREAQAAQQAAASARIIDEYKQRIIDKVRRFIVEPPNLGANAEVEFDVVVLPGGEVLGAKLKRSSNSMPAYDAAVERAILKAQPLPLPPDPALMRQFRELNLKFRPEKR
jgi:colicin import membrane protein